MNEHPEATMYSELAEDMEFPELRPGKDSFPASLYGRSFPGREIRDTTGKSVNWRSKCEGPNSTNAPQREVCVWDEQLNTCIIKVSISNK